MCKFSVVYYFYPTMAAVFGRNRPAVYTKAIHVRRGIHGRVTSEVINRIKLDIFNSKSNTSFERIKKAFFYESCLNFPSAVFWICDSLAVRFPSILIAFYYESCLNILSAVFWICDSLAVEILLYITCTTL